MDTGPIINKETITTYDTCSENWALHRKLFLYNNFGHYFQQYYILQIFFQQSLKITNQNLERQVFKMHKTCRNNFRSKRVKNVQLIQVLKLETW